MRTRQTPVFISRLRALLIVIATAAAAMTCSALASAHAKPATTSPPNCPYGRICGLKTGQAVPGCSSGDVCVYNGSTFASGVELRYYTYNDYNLHSQYGRHLVVNNQHYDSHFHEVGQVSLCTGYNGTKQLYDSVDEGDYQVENLTPVNSIVVNADPYPLNVPNCNGE